MSKTMEDAVGLGPMSQRRREWKARLRSKRPWHAARIAVNIVFHLTFLLVLLPLPLKIVALLTGSMSWLAWWLVFVLIAVGVVVGSVTERFERPVIRGIVKAASPRDAAGPFSFLDEPLRCPGCGQEVLARTPKRGYFACRCGEFVSLKDGEIDVVQP